MLFSRRHPASFSRERGAFTLVEVLTVIAVVVILISLGFGVARRASEAGRTARARAELALLQAALDSYQRAGGDYPRTDDPAVLLQVLIGRRGAPFTAVAGHGYLDYSRLPTANQKDPLVDSSAVLVDPWGNPYRYAYRTSTAWRNPFYVLYSPGPDGRSNDALRNGGFPDTAIPDNFDNLYAAP